MRIAFLLYPTSKVKIDEDSSFWIMWELQKRGHEVFYFESKKLLGSHEGPLAFLTKARLHEKKGYLDSPPSLKSSALADLDCIFIRKEPPFDKDYLYSLQLLQTIKHQVFVLNDPCGIAMANEKLFPLNFKNLTPETLVTENKNSAKKFIKDLGKKVVIKPLNQKGGAGIFFTDENDKNLSSLLEMATRGDRRKILIQRFIDHQSSGDKRIVLLNGEALGSFVRKPPRNDFRANLSVGATMHRSTLTKSDKKIVETINPTLLNHGLFFVGIDVIGRYLTEVNVTSPAGIPELKALYGSRPERAVADFIENHLSFFDRKHCAK